MPDDATLLQRYAEDGAEDAFAELVRRHIDGVFSAAVRRVGGDVQLAEDVAQQVFVVLARHAAVLTRHPALTVWLYVTTRNEAANVVRRERRRKARELEAHIMQPISSDGESPVDWSRVAPVLDGAIDQLSDADRAAVLLRFVDRRAFAEIGAALKISDDAARMRVDRALGKLHALLARRGVTSTAAALGVALAQQATLAAPVGMAASVTGAALSGATAAGGGVATLKVLSFMSTTKIMAGVAGLAVIAATAITLRQEHTQANLREQIAGLQREHATVATLRDENRRLVAEKTAIEEVAHAEHTELVRLREGRDALRKAMAAGQASAANRAGGGAGENRAGGENGGLAPGMVSTELMTNVGRATPAAAGQTLGWALRQADFKAAAEVLTFRAPEREKLEAFIATLPEASRAAYGTPEQIVALVMAGSPRPIAAAQVLSRTQPDADTEIAQVEWQYQSGEVERNTLEFHREADGWKQIVSPALTDRVIAYLKAKQ